MEAWREELYSNELYHFGILGMRWGHRRYQNPDGTYTEAGKKRYFGQGASKAFDRSIKRGKDKENISPAEEMSKHVGEGIGGALNLASDIATIRNKKKGRMEKKFTQYDRNISKKSDQQLKKEIDRMSSELRWDELDDRIVNKGKTTVEDYRRVMNDVLTVTGTAIGIASLIVSIKRKTG